jgi:hypothetical protein
LFGIYQPKKTFERRNTWRSAFPARTAAQYSAKTGADQLLHEKTLRTNFFEVSRSWFSLLAANWHPSRDLEIALNSNHRIELS